MKKKKLNDCPFCGGKAELQTGETCGETQKTEYFVRCNLCGTSSSWWNLESEAVWAWNRRTCKCEKMDERAIEEIVKGAMLDTITYEMDGQYDGYTPSAMIFECYERTIQAIRYQLTTPVEQEEVLSGDE